MSFVTFNSKDKIWSGDTHQTIFNPNVSLGYLILNEFKKTPERITQVSADTGVQVTCREMRQRSIKLVKHLQSLGMKQGDIIGIMASNSENLAPIVFACFTLGLPINPLAPGMLESDVIHMFSKTKPKLIFCDSAVTKILQNSVNKIVDIKPVIYTLMEKVAGYIFVQDVLSNSCETVDFVFPELVDIANSTAVILCSSGTTGLAKGICRTHAQFIQHFCPLWDIDNEKQEVYLNFSTILWSTGITFLVVGSLFGGLRVITTKVFDPTLAVEIFDRYQVTTFLTAPYAISKIVQIPNLKPFESIRAFMATGTNFSEKLSKLLEPFVPNGKIISIYGTSETGPVAGAFKLQRYGSCGVPSRNVQMKIIDETGNHLGPNQTGEICFKTKVMFSGYFAEPEKTSETIVNGWIESGDIGYIDDDGFVFIVDRKKAILRYDCFQVFPSQLEAIIDEIEGVIKSSVVGVTDESGNDIIFAFVVKDPNANDLSAVGIENYVNGKVTDSEKLRGGVHFIEAIPLTLSGKVQRQEVKRIAMCLLRQQVFRSSLNTTFKLD